MRSIMNTTRKILLSKFTIILVLLMMLLGCAGMNSAQQRTLSGGAMGAGAGAAIGAVIGGAAGAAGGYLYDKSKK